MFFILNISLYLSGSLLPVSNIIHDIFDHEKDGLDGDSHDHFGFIDYGIGNIPRARFVPFL